MIDPFWTPEALQDRDDIYNYIEHHNPIAALTLDSRFSEQALRLSGHPALGRPGRVAGTRELVVHRHYVIVYEVTGGAVRILRVMHASRQWP